MAWLPPRGKSRDELGRYHSLNMKATSAAMVPFAGSPDSMKQSRSSQLSTNGSVICPSVTLLLAQLHHDLQTAARNAQISHGGDCAS